MSARLLYAGDGLLWLANSILWTWYAHSPALGVLTLLAAVGCAFMAWRTRT